jgi:hypothetical protein
MNSSLTYKNESFQKFDAMLKVDMSKKRIEDERRKFLIYLADNLELLNNFSDDKLERILKYSEEENERRKLLKNKS